MTSRERMRKVLDGGIPDRVPFHPSIYYDHACLACGQRFEDVLINPLDGNPRMLECALRYRTDTVRFNIVPPAEWFRDKAVIEQDGQLYQIDRRTGRKEGTFDVAGGGSFYPFEPASPVRTRRDAESIPVISTVEYFQRGHFTGLRECIDLAHEHGLFVVGFCTGQTINFLVQKLGGPEPALLSFYDDPDLVRALIDKAVESSIELGKAYLEAGADFIYIGDSYASGSVISPRIYESFCAPAYCTLATELRRHGAYVYKHCCGYYDPLLDQLPSTNIHAMDGIDPTTGMSVRHTKEVIGNRLTLMGGLSCMTLLQGTPEQVRREASECILAGKPGGRYVLGSACAVPRMTPPENLLAARGAIDDYGRYDQ